MVINGSRILLVVCALGAIALADIQKVEPLFRYVRDVAIENAKAKANNLFAAFASDGAGYELSAKATPVVFPIDQPQPIATWALPGSMPRVGRIDSGPDHTSSEATDSCACAVHSHRAAAVAIASCLPRAAMTASCRDRGVSLRNNVDGL